MFCLFFVGCCFLFVFVSCCLFRWLTRAAQLFATSPSVCAERLCDALLRPERGAVLTDQHGQELQPMSNMTEQTTQKVFQHCKQVVDNAVSAKQ
jgi:hypothetical protein